MYKGFERSKNNFPHIYRILNLLKEIKYKEAGSCLVKIVDCIIKTAYLWPLRNQHVVCFYATPSAANHSTLFTPQDIFSSILFLHVKKEVLQK